MTLQEWVDNGSAMLSNYTSAWCCQIARISERQLRALPLHDVYAIPMAGELAKREHDRWIAEGRYQEAPL